MNVPRYPTASINIDRVDRNAVGIVVAVSGALRSQRVPDDEVAEFQQTALSADYDHVLRTAAQWVSLVSDQQASECEFRTRFPGVKSVKLTGASRPASVSQDNVGQILAAYARASGSGRPGRGRL